MKKIIIAISGHIASGKDVTKKYLEEKYGAKNCKFSTPIRDVCNRLLIPTSRENLQKISTVLRENFGEDLFAKIIASDAQKLDSEVVVIDGVRRMADVEYIKDLDNYVLIKIEADPHIRHQRVVMRNENQGDNKKTFEEFLKDNEAETELQINNVMSSATYALENNGNIEDLYKQIDEIMSKVLN